MLERDACDALVGLGYRRTQVREVVRAVMRQQHGSATLDAVIRAALVSLGQRH